MQLIQGLLLVCLTSYVSCCGKGRKKGPPVLPGKDNKGGDVIQRMVGDGITAGPYSPSGDDQVKTCDELSCNFDGGCCWSNNKPPKDELEWVKGSGQPETAKMQKSFGTTSVPDGSFLITASETAGSSSQTAQLYSCPVKCAKGDVTVKLRHWQSSGCSLQVCQLDDPSGSPSNCKDLSSSSGQADSVTLPGGENKRIAIIAKGFSNADGTVAMIDDVSVQCEACPDTTPAPPPTPAPTPAQTPAPTKAPAATTKKPAAKPPCKEINCNFEQGNPCSYSPSSSGGSAYKNWGVETAPYQNSLTGVKKNDEGKKFAATYLKKKGEKSTLVTKAKFDKEYLVDFDYYKAVDGVDLRCCCNDESHCPFDTTPDVDVSHYKVWRKATIKCPAGTKQVLFVADNKRGSSEGAVGVDKIRLMQPSGSGGSPAC